MADKKEANGDEQSVNRRKVLRQSAVTGGALWGLSGVASATQSSSKEALFDSEAIQSIEQAVPHLQIRPEDAHATAEAHAAGQSIRVKNRSGTLRATKLPDGTIFAVFRFPGDVPRNELNIDEDIPNGAKAMLIGSHKGVSVVRSASPQERSHILETAGYSDKKNVHVTTTSERDGFEVSQMELEDKTIKRAAVRPRAGMSVTGDVSGAANFEVVSESTITPESAPTASYTAQSCDCSDLVPNIVLCLSSLNACKAAFGCGAFGGPVVVLACAVASGCIHGVVTEIFVSDMPGCVNLGQDLWDLCFTECVS